MAILALVGVGSWSLWTQRPLVSGAGTPTRKTTAAATKAVAVAEVTGPLWRLTARVVDEQGHPVSGGMANVTVDPGAVDEGDEIADGEPSPGAGTGAGSESGMGAAADDGASAAVPSAPAGWSLRATIDAGGKFALQGLPRLALRLDVSVPGYETLSRRLDFGADGAEVTDIEEMVIVLRRAAVLRGYVIDPDGKPAAGATVVIGGSGMWPPRNWMTGADGSFVAEGIAGGIYELRASRGSFVSDPREGYLLEPGADDTVELQLKAGVTLRGLVVSASDQAPLPNASLVLSEGALAFVPRSLKTDAAGAFVLEGLRKVPHQLVAHVEGFVPTTTVVDLAVPRMAEEVLRIELRTASSVRGLVVDEAGLPVPFAALEVHGTSDVGVPVFLTGVTEGFSRSLLVTEGAPAPAQVSGGGELGVVPGPVAPIPITPLPVAPTSTPGLESAPLIDQSGIAAAALPRATVPATSDFRSREDGTFALTGLPPGKLQLFAHSPGFAIGRSEEFTLAAGTSLDDIKVVMVRGGRLVGRLVDMHGAPLAYVRIEVVSTNDLAVRGGVSAEDGSFAFDSLLGEVKLRAYPRGQPPIELTAVVRAGETSEVSLSLQARPTRLRGRLYDSKGFPVPSVLIRVRSREGNTSFAEIFTAEDGTFDAADLPVPPFALVVEHGDYASLRAVVDRESVKRELRLVLEDATSISGALVLADSGEALANTLVLVEGPDGYDGRLSTDALGAFVFRRATQGRYVLRIEKSGFVPMQRSFVVERGARGLAAKDLGRLALVPGGTIRGEVVDSLGDAVPMAQVTARAEGRSGTATSNARGEFLIEGLAEGVYQLHAEHEKAGAVLRDTAVRLFPREVRDGYRLRLSGRLPL